MPEPEPTRAEAVSRRSRTALKFGAWALATPVALLAGVYLVSQVTPRPLAMLIDRLMRLDGDNISAELARHVRPGAVRERRAQRYDTAQSEATLDVYSPAGAADVALARPTVVWVHGGGFLSGSKEQIAGYLRVIAARGFMVVGVGYTLAPAARYPTPVFQLNAALAYLRHHSEDLALNGEKFVIAGDSAGAHIAAQLSTAISSEPYAKLLDIAPALQPSQLAGALLFCGPYDLTALNLEGPASIVVKTMLWTYTGKREFWTDPAASAFSVVAHVTPEFPPAFISAGNADPLEPQSRKLAQTLERRGVRVQTLFFPQGHNPPLPHEYQFKLDTPDAQLALDRAVDFLEKATSNNASPP